MTLLISLTQQRIKFTPSIQRFSTIIQTPQLSKLIFHQTVFEERMYTIQNGQGVTKIVTGDKSSHLHNCIPSNISFVN